MGVRSGLGPSLGALALTTAALAWCAPYLAPAPRGPGYFYGRIGAPYRAERHGDPFGGGYRRAFAVTTGGPVEGEPGPLVGGTPFGYVYNAHLGDAGEPLTPAPASATPAVDAGPPPAPAEPAGGAEPVDGAEPAAAGGPDGGVP